MSSNDSNSDPPTLSSTSSPNAPGKIKDRTPLIEKARAFLLSPTIRHENEVAKRSFLQDKGLSSEEIDGLMQELPRQPPPIPPRTYPPPPPSNLPVLIASLFRAFTWAAGISGFLLLGYYRILLPRVARSLGARHKLKMHQSNLMTRLQGRIDEVKDTQEDVYDALSAPEVEVLPANNKSLAELPVDDNGDPTHSLRMVLTCALHDQQKLTVEELYLRLSKQFPGITKKDEREYKRLISRVLSYSRSFDKTTEGDLEYWLLCQEAVTDSTSALAVPTYPTQPLEKLRNAVSQGYRGRNTYQHTFKSLTDLTAYLSRETFALYGAGTGFRHNLPSGHALSPAEEDVRREIRALKGLVLNRRSFAPTPYRLSQTAIAGAAT